MSWESVFPGSNFDEEYHGNGQFDRYGVLSYFISSCFFFGLTDDSAVKISSQSNDDAKTYVTQNKFESCSSGSHNGGSLYFSSKGQIVQTKNSYLKDGVSLA